MGAFVNRKSLSPSPTDSSLPIPKEPEISASSQFPASEEISQATVPESTLPLQPETEAEADQASVSSSAPMQADPVFMPSLEFPSTQSAALQREATVAAHDSPATVENASSPNQASLQLDPEPTQLSLPAPDSSPEANQQLLDPPNPSIQSKAKQPTSERLTSEQTPEAPAASEAITALNPQPQRISETSASPHQSESTTPSQGDSLSASPTHSSLPIQRESELTTQSQFPASETVSQATIPDSDAPIQREEEFTVDLASGSSRSPMQAEPASMPSLQRSVEIGNDDPAIVPEPQPRSQELSVSQTTVTNELSVQRQSDATSEPLLQNSIPDQGDAKFASEAIQQSVEEEVEDASPERSETNSDAIQRSV